MVIMMTSEVVTITFLISMQCLFCMCMLMLVFWLCVCVTAHADVDKLTPHQHKVIPLHISQVL